MSTLPWSYLNQGRKRKKSSGVRPGMIAPFSNLDLYTWQTSDIPLYQDNHVFKDINIMFNL